MKISFWSTRKGMRAMQMAVLCCFAIQAGALAEPSNPYAALSDELIKKIDALDKQMWELTSAQQKNADEQDESLKKQDVASSKQSATFEAYMAATDDPARAQANIEASRELEATIVKGTELIRQGKQLKARYEALSANREKLFLELKEETARLKERAATQRELESLHNQRQIIWQLESLRQKFDQ